MPIVTINGAAYEVAAGTCLSDVLTAAGSFRLPCGGQGRCGNCRVTVAGRPGKLSALERERLTGEEIARGIRLACCATVETDCTVFLPKAGAEQIRMDGVLPSLTLDPLFSAYGAAVDIGTTTLAARLYDTQGRLLATAGCSNPQSRWGADVISRTQASLAGQGASIAAVTVNAIDDLLKMLAKQAEIDPCQIDGLVLTGNTTMLHLLTATPVEPLSHAPFAVERLFGETMDAADLGSTAVAPHARVYLPPCISAFVGADTTCAILADGLCDTPDTRLLTDIGTNGEMALWHDGRLFVCSTAAGPAFEGAGIHMGMPGIAGAVDHVTVQNGALHAHVIGETTPTGICGSGVVDAVACLLQTGQLDETGLLDEDPTFILPPVCLTQNDIRQVQLAKSAIHAGILTLLNAVNIGGDTVSSLSVAGGFGSYLDIENAGVIGLIPCDMTARVRVIGNAALAGASMLLLDRSSHHRCEHYQQTAATVDLPSNPYFAESYMMSMLFE